MTDGSVPDGKLRVVVTFLEMTAKPKRPALVPPAMKLALLHAEQPTVSFYRYLYDTVGEDWLWYERRRLSDAALRRIIQSSNVLIYVLYVAGVPAGYVELDARHPPDIELAYLGLVPEYIGHGLGRYLLDWAVDTAWDRGPKRLWVRNSHFNHPHAIALYQQAGFEPYKQEEKIIDDPRRLGLIPPDKGPADRGPRPA